MMPFTEYLVKVSLGFVVVSLLYVLVLRRLTFYSWNRFYLLAASALCFFIPFFDVSPMLNRLDSYSGQEIVQQVPSVSRVLPNPVTPAMTMSETPHAQLRVAPEQHPVDWLLIVWGVGVAAMLVRLMVRILSMARIMRRAQLAYHDGVRIYHLDQDISPFSFGKAVFYNPALHRDDDLPDIMLHELVHVRQHHTFDVIWGELLCMINWFNPLVWLLSYGMRQNLEYIADREVLESHPDSKAYQYLLLKTTLRADLSLANQFGYPSLKKRIAMMNRKRSPRLALVSFLLLLPLTALLLAAFRPELPTSPRQQASYPITGSRQGWHAGDAVLISGLILDNLTGKPITNMALTMERQKIAPTSTGNIIFADGVAETIGTIYTDKDGFFFKSIQRDSLDKDLYSYAFGHKGTLYKEFSFDAGHQLMDQAYMAFPVVFAQKKDTPANKRSLYWANLQHFQVQSRSQDLAAALKSYLYAELPPLLAENKLRTEFKLRYKFPKNVITRFRDGYFDRNRELMGYVGKLQFYLNGKKASYQEVNEAFRGYPYQLGVGHEHRQNSADLNTKIAYLTFPLYRDTPPPALVKGNVEIINVDHFDPAKLKNAAYMLDGFRQVAGVGSNLMPQKDEIRSVVLMKGKLARYYDRAQDTIWWVETRPAAEVFGRPDFATR
ncbi:M56 family metallopeptidase [Dyadobacter sandarakinus]|uniref:M56 family metallopeptidase n=1 Tax=Dyadobacter sandarakinus TaxID=2747268 RepID=A0ABX7I3Y1_9BACT|nr:M56 family metallopeptidase [Dyadobacter sandarakinus]QRR00222.1 M56 family metallopeptidase [Dyadobacter sandarakinus]